MVSRRPRRHRSTPPAASFIDCRYSQASAGNGVKTDGNGGKTVIVTQPNSMFEHPREGMPAVAELYQPMESRAMTGAYRIAVIAASVAGAGNMSLAVCAAADVSANAPLAVVLHCRHMLDTQAGILRGETTVMIEGQRIKEVIGGRQNRASATEIDLSGTCLPGLIDSHTHLTSETSPTRKTDEFRWNVADYAVRSTVYARRTLLAGFTTVRDVGDSDYKSVALRNAINEGVLPGPRIFTAGVPIGSTGGHADPTDGYRQDLAGDPGVREGIINSPEDAWKAVREHYKAGVDLIKIMPSGGVLDESPSGDNPQLTPAEVKAVVEAAHDYGFTVAAHAHGAEAIRRAIEAGVDSIEHGTYLDERDIELMKRHGTWLVPTISAGEFVAEKAKEPGYYTGQVAKKAETIGPLLIDTASRAYKAGVKIAFGTDASVYPHGQNAHEFELMVRAGIPALYAIQSATTHAAELLRHQDDLGSISVGKYADIIAVAGNPLEDITVMKRVDFVMKDGKICKQEGKVVLEP
jgi:imidazolonepropionase-like amidohydrolase